MTTSEEYSVDQLVDFYKPSLMARIKSTMIDTIIVIVLLYVAFMLLEALRLDSMVLRLSIFGLILFYEPILTSMNRTFGQKVMGLRVRKFKEYANDENEVNINIASSIVRYLTKIFLGWISLLTIHSDRYGQALHDKIGNSLMTIEK